MIVQYEINILGSNINEKPNSTTSVMFYFSALILCVLDVVENMNFEMFNLMSETNETRHIEQHKTCNCICRLNANARNNKQRWNNEKCKCKCKELVDIGRC